jgi:hypothetical protein
MRESDEGSIGWTVMTQCSARFSFLRVQRSRAEITFLEYDTRSVDADGAVEKC